jgi:2-oxoglutarate ferredoxin oxidoreductase subunit alpha
MHRVGGIEKEDGTGNISYDPENHQKMVNIRAQKVANAAKLLPPQQVLGPQSGELLVLSWGGTYGACLTAVQQAQEAGRSVALAHIRYLNPFPSNLGEIISRYEKVLIPELNMGQLRMLIRSRYLVDAVGYNKVKGKPFTVTELFEKICEMTKSAHRPNAVSTK